MSSSSANIGNDLLWRECAGHNVKVPRVGDRVFYFPQGHLEHVAACMNEENIAIPSDGLPSKILCKVIDVSLKAEAVTEELYAEITLHPICEENEFEGSTTVPENVPASSFRRILTDYDVSTQGGLTLRKNDAKNTFPPLDKSLDPASENLVAKDLHGETWHFQHVYRATSKRHYLTTGWNKFVSEKRLVAGDTCIFLRWQNEIYVGVQRAIRMHKQPPRHLPYLSILRGIISDALVNKDKNHFTVYYHPRVIASPFIVAYDEVMESLKVNYSQGMRFELLSDEGREDDADNIVNTLTGTIIDVGDIDPIRWRESEWLCLQVRWAWGATLYRGVLPQRVSPWSIRPLRLEGPHQ